MARKMISIHRGGKYASMYTYLGIEDKYMIVWTQAISKRGLLGIGHFGQEKYNSLGWQKTMHNRRLNEIRGILEGKKKK